MIQFEALFKSSYIFGSDGGTKFSTSHQMSGEPLGPIDSVGYLPTLPE